MGGVANAIGSIASGIGKIAEIAAPIVSIIMPPLGMAMGAGSKLLQGAGNFMQQMDKEAQEQEALDQKERYNARAAGDDMMGAENILKGVVGGAVGGAGGILGGLLG
jgi:hypothetical protein